MSKGVSLHIGLNNVNPQHYNGWNQALEACINDAQSMGQIAVQRKFSQVRLLLEEQATKYNLVYHLLDYAKILNEGDLLFITYAGHGGRREDINKDESDNYDEGWCLYDGFLLDDDVFKLWSYFKTGVKIFVISDSCHSGTIIRNQIPYLFDFQKKTKHKFNLNDNQNDIINLNSQDTKHIKASIRLLSACRDYQYAAERNGHGRFTDILLNIWSEGYYNKSYLDLFFQIKSRLPERQQPQYSKLGLEHAAFDNQIAFWI